MFVGREAELKQLQSAFDGAMSGQGALMMVMGEPGIGKTASDEQLATYVTLRGGKTLVGHCYEEGSLSLPYLAFVEAMRSYVLGREAEDLKKELGTGATDVARIVSEIRERLNVKLRTAREPRGRPLPAAAGGDRLPDQCRRGAAAAGRPGRPARRRQGHAGDADPCLPQPRRAPGCSSSAPTGMSR